MSTPSRRTVKSLYSCSDESVIKSPLGGYSTPQRRRFRGFESSGSTPSTLLARMSGNLHMDNGTPLGASTRVAPTTPSSGARRQPSTPTTTRRLSRTPSSSSQGDRFIPHRSSINFDLCNHMLRNGVNAENEPQAGSEASTPLRREFRQAMKTALLSPMPGGYNGAKSDRKGAPTSTRLSPRLLSFSEKPLAKEERCTNVLKVLHSISNTSIARASVSRSIPSAPLRILDAPDLVDDYYLNLISWGHNNVLAVALGQSVYLWNATTGSIDHLLTLQGPNDFVTSVEWMGKDGGSYLAVGTNHSAIELWDGSKLKLVRTMTGHSARVGTLAWKRHLLSSGSRDSSILQHDIRMAHHKIATFAGHEQEVCGLKWSPDGSTLASGGNENFLCLWDASISGGGGGRRGSRQGSLSSVHRPRNTLVQHQAAVKALAWCPFQRHLLASGGGTADRTIKFWNTADGSMLNSIDTGSQVCSLQWSRHKKEIVSSHGFSENQLCLWKYPSMLKVKEFRGHTSRVLHMDTSPDGCTVVSAAADETLRFWDMFGTPGNKSRKGDKGMEHGVPGSLTTMHNLR